MSELTATPGHLASEFYAWLWWASETRESTFELPDRAGSLELWVDERLAFRNPNEARVSAVMTGEAPSTSLEARAALAGGKVLHEIRIGVRRDDKEFYATLKGPMMHLQGVKLPVVLEDQEDEILYDRLFLYEELVFVLRSLFREFCASRTSGDWRGDVLPRMERWATGEA